MGKIFWGIKFLLDTGIPSKIFSKDYGAGNSDQWFLVARFQFLA